MIEIRINENDGNQRLDRFLRKYLSEAPLSVIYKSIRKDIKINGKRGKEHTMLEEGDRIQIYIPEDRLEKYTTARKRKHVKKQFGIVYEDDNVIIVSKPLGLLTHGDGKEKKNHLTNQVIDYLIEEKKYNPRVEKSFVPAPCNRLDRNTTGLVIFGKNAEAVRQLNQALKERNRVKKFYRTIVSGRVDEKIRLTDHAIKDREKNRMMLTNSEEGVTMETIVEPVISSKQFTLLDVNIITGRTHQIRAQLSKNRTPVIGDPKYGDYRLNQQMKKRYGLRTQLLHAQRLEFSGFVGELANLNGKEIRDEYPELFERIKTDIFD